MMKKIVTTILILVFTIQSTGAYAFSRNSYALRTPASNKTGVPDTIAGAMHETARKPAVKDKNIRQGYKDLEKVNEHAYKILSLADGLYSEAVENKDGYRIGGAIEFYEMFFDDPSCLRKVNEKKLTKGIRQIVNIASQKLQELRQILQELREKAGDDISKPTLGYTMHGRLIPLQMRLVEKLKAMQADKKEGEPLVIVDLGIGENGAPTTFDFIEMLQEEGFNNVVINGVDINPLYVSQARKELSKIKLAKGIKVEFKEGGFNLKKLGLSDADMVIASNVFLGKYYTPGEQKEAIKLLLGSLGEKGVLVVNEGPFSVEEDMHFRIYRQDGSQESEEFIGEDEAQGSSASQIAGAMHEAANGKQPAEPDKGAANAAKGSFSRFMQHAKQFTLKLFKEAYKPTLKERALEEEIKKLKKATGNERYVILNEIDKLREVDTQGFTERNLALCIELLRSTDQHIRNNGLRVIDEFRQARKAAFTERNLTAVVELLKDQNADIRRAALEAIGEFISANRAFATEQTHAFVAELLKDPRPDVQKVAEKIIEKIKKSDSVRLLSPDQVNKKPKAFTVQPFKNRVIDVAEKFESARWLRRGNNQIPVFVSKKHDAIVGWIEQLQEQGIVKKDTTIINLDAHPDSIRELFESLNEGSWMRWLKIKGISTGKRAWVKRMVSNPISRSREEEEVFCYGDNIFESIEKLKEKVSGPAIISICYDFVAFDREGQVTKEEVAQRTEAIVQMLTLSGIVPVAIHFSISEIYLAPLPHTTIPPFNLTMQEVISGSFIDAFKGEGCVFEAGKAEQQGGIAGAMHEGKADNEPFDALMEEAKDAMRSGDFAKADKLLLYARIIANPGREALRVEKLINTLKFLMGPIRPPKTRSITDLTICEGLPDEVLEALKETSAKAKILVERYDYTVEEFNALCDMIFKHLKRRENIFSKTLKQKHLLPPSPSDVKEFFEEISNSKKVSPEIAKISRSYSMLVDDISKKELEEKKQLEMSYQAAFKNATKEERDKIEEALKSGNIDALVKILEQKRKIDVPSEELIASYNSSFALKALELLYSDAVERKDLTMAGKIIDLIIFASYNDNELALRLLNEAATDEGLSFDELMAKRMQGQEYYKKDKKRPWVLPRFAENIEALKDIKRRYSQESNGKQSTGQITGAMHEATEPVEPLTKIAGIYSWHVTASSFKNVKKHLDDIFAKAKKEGKKIVFVRENGGPSFKACKRGLPEIMSGIEPEDIISESKDQEKLDRFKQAFKTLLLREEAELQQKDFSKEASEMQEGSFGHELYSYLAENKDIIEDIYLEGQDWKDALFENYINEIMLYSATAAAALHRLAETGDVDKYLKEMEEAEIDFARESVKRDVEFSSQLKRIMKKVENKKVIIVYTRGIGHFCAGVIENEIGDELQEYAEYKTLSPWGKLQTAMTNSVYEPINEKPSEQEKEKLILATALEVVLSQRIIGKFSREADNQQDALFEIIPSLTTTELRHILSNLRNIDLAAQKAGIPADIYTLGMIFSAHPELIRYASCFGIAINVRRKQETGDDKVKTSTNEKIEVTAGRISEDTNALIENRVENITRNLLKNIGLIQGLNLFTDSEMEELKDTFESIIQSKDNIKINDQDWNLLAKVSKGRIEISRTLLFELPDLELESIILHEVVHLLKKQIKRAQLADDLLKSLPDKVSAMLSPTQEGRKNRENLKRHVALYVEDEREANTAAFAYIKAIGIDDLAAYFTKIYEQVKDERLKSCYQYFIHAVQNPARMQDAFRLMTFANSPTISKETRMVMNNISIIELKGVFIGQDIYYEWLLDWLKKYAHPDSGDRIAGAMHESGVPELRKFFDDPKHMVFPRMLETGALYGPTPYTMLPTVFEDIKHEVGDLTGKKLLDFGAGGLKASLYAAVRYKMKSIAIEKDAEISKKGQQIYDEAMAAGLIKEGDIKYTGNADAFDAPWKDFDVVYFYYTEPLYESDFNAFRAKFKQKMAEMKKGSVVALLFLPEYFDAKDSFKDVENIYPSRETVLTHNDISYCLKIFTCGGTGQITGAMHEAATKALVAVEACANSIKLYKDADFQSILAKLSIKQANGRDIVFSGALFEKIGFIVPLIAQRIKGRIGVILSKDLQSQRAQRAAIERLNQNIPDAQKIILIHPESGMLPQGIRLGNIKYLRLEQDEASWVHDFSSEKVYVTEQMLKAIGAINATISDEIEKFKQSIEALKQA